MGSLNIATVLNTFNRNVNYNDLGATLIGGVLLSDDFNTTPLSTQRWNITLAGNGAVSIVSNQLKFVPPSGINNYQYLESNQAVDMVDESFQVDIAGHSTGSGSCEAYLQLADEDGGYCYIYEANGNALFRIFNKNGSQAVSQVYEMGTATGYDKWRIRHSSVGGTHGTIYLDVYTGGAWVQKQSATPDWSPAKAIFTFINGDYGYNGGASSAWILDNVVFSGDDNSNVPPPISTDQKILEKNVGGTGWNAGIYTKFYMPAPVNDQSVRFMVKDGTLGYRQVGWASRDFLGTDYGLSLGFYLRGDNGKIMIMENNVEVNDTGRYYGDKNELRIQIILVSGVYKVRYHYRIRNGKGESMIYESTKTHQEILNMFPLHGKITYYNQNTKIANFQIEENGVGTNQLSVSPVGELIIPVRPFVMPLEVSLGRIVPTQGVSNEEIMIEIPKKITSTGTILVARLPIPGTIIGMELVTEGTASGTKTFDIKKNGVSVFSGAEQYLTINNSTPIANSEVSFAGAENDKVELTCMSFSGPPLERPLFLKLTISV